MIDQAIKLGHEVVAITEHETIASAIDAENYYNKIKKDNPNFKVILGNEIYLCRNGLNPRNYDTSQDKWYHFILLAKDEIGHKQIRELSTRAWMRAEVYRKMMRVPTYYQDLYDIIGKNPGHVIASTACFKAGTKVETMHGWKNIEDIQTGDFVINRYGEWEEVIKPTSMFTHQYGYEFEITGNAQPIICTDNHEFLVITNKSKTPKWVQAKHLNLTPGSSNKHIALEPVNRDYYSQKPVIYKQEWNDSYLKENQSSHRRIKLPEEIKITPELMRLFGLFLGDGCISLKENPRISFTFNEKEYNSYMQSFINKASEELGITWSVSIRPENHRVDITSSSADLINLFYYLFGDVKADTKQVPSRLRISKELDYELIFGYFLADGYFRTRTNAGKATGYTCGEFVSASISRQLSYDIYHILNELNITSSISYSKKRIDKNGVNHKDAWYVSGANKILGAIDKTKIYTPEEIINIFEEAIKIKEKDFITIDGIRYRKIRFKKATKIELNETVYCLNNTTHSFKCENLIVHNCLGGALPTQILRNREKGDNSLWDKIKLWCTTLNNLFKGDFYLEMQPSNNEEQIYVNNKIIELSEELNIPFIITNDAHYLNKAQRPIHKAFLNAKDGDREVDDFYATTYLMDDIELKSFMEKHIGIENMEKAYKSIKEIKDKCEDYSLKKALKIPRLSWKQYRETTQMEEWLKRIPMLKTFLDSEYSEDVHLAKVVIDILEHNPMNDETLNTQATYDELNACFDDIWVSSEANNARWSAYLLNLQNIIDLCWEAGSLVGPGRGSGVGFLLLYILGITQINPLREKAKTFRFRFLNPKRVSPLDVDIDIESTKREVVLNSFRKQYGDDRVAGVMTFKTEGSKSAILTAARGLGIDNDIAQYLASMIEAERGQLRTLNQTFYGDAENGIKPNKQFRYEMETNYPELWEVAKNIEGLCCGVGVHAGGVVFVDEPFTESNALMRSPKGEIITQFDLHQSESVGNIKYDVLSIKGLDNIHNCLTLLGDYGYIPQDTLKNMYENTVGIYNLEREDINMWKMLWNHEVFSLFQMEKQSGINGIEVLKPTSVEDLAILNSTIRLMAQEKGGEMPTDKLARFKSDPSEWDDELRRNGLGQEARELLEPILGLSYGLCIAQEQFMQLVQLPELGGFPLEFADRLRKSIAKKNPAEYEEVTKEFYQVTAAKGCDDKLCRYVWDKLIAMSRGYGFNLSHTLAYSLVGLQELNLAYLYPVLFWNCACLIVDSGSAGAGENEDEEEEYEYEEEEYDDDDIFYEEVEEQDEAEETVKKTTKKKAIKHDYGRIATAIGKMRADGVGIQSPDINSSYYTFSPNIDDNMILFGLSGITKVGQELVQAIMANRPYTSIEDFLSKVKVNKTQMVSLIKSGAFDNLYGGDRRLAMDTYIDIIADKKKRITLQNMQKLIQYGLIPQEYELQIRFFNFNKYLRKLKCGTYFNLDNIAYQFYEKYCDIDDLVPNVEAESGFHIDATTWKKKYYDKQMDIIRPWVKSNSETLLRKVNDRLRKEVCDKYATGEINKWEMDAVSCYFHKHELEDVDAAFYGCDHFEDLPEDPDIDYTFVKNGRTIPIFKINRIMGTVLDRDKLKKTVTLLTTDGVVTVKIYGQIFSNYDKQISEKGADGKKHIVEKSWFTRGNKIIVTGMRRGTNEFVAKKYKKTPYSLVELITKVNNNGTIETQDKRYENY